MLDGGVPNDHAHMRRKKRTTKKAQGYRRAYIRYAVIPAVGVLTLLVSIPLVRTSFEVDSSSRWIASIFWFLTYLVSTFMVSLPYRTAFHKKNSNKPIIDLKSWILIILAVGLANASLAFLQNAFIPDDITAEYDSSQTGARFWVADTFVWVFQFFSFFVLLPYIHYAAYARYLDTLPPAEADGDTYTPLSPVSPLTSMSPSQASPSAVGLTSAVLLQHDDATAEDQFRGTSLHSDVSVLPQLPELKTFSWMTPFAVVFILYAFVVVNLDRHSVSVFYGVPFFILLWGFCLYLDRNAKHSRLPAYVVMVSFSTIALPTAGSRVMWDALHEVGQDQGLQFLVVFVWNLLMLLLEVLVRRTVRICYHKNTGSAFAFVWAVQFFDDVFVALAFLKVTTFNAVFFLLLVWQFIRDYVRDVGLRMDIYFLFISNVLSRRVSLEDRIVALSEQMRITDQNLTSELVSAILVPVAIALDRLFRSMDVGVDSITVKSHGALSNLLLGYVLLIFVQLLNHWAVLHGLHRKQRRLHQIVAVSQGQVALLERQSTEDRDDEASIANKETYGRPRRQSLAAQFWREEKEMTKHWRRQLMFFVATTVYGILQGMWVVTELRYRDLRGH